MRPSAMPVTSRHIKVTFGVLDAGFQRQEVGFHVSDLPEYF